MLITFLGVFSFLAWGFCTLIFVLGMINPKLAIFKYAKQGRSKVFKVWFLSGAAFFIILIIAVLSSPSNNTITLETNSLSETKNIKTSEIEETPKAIATSTPAPTEIEYNTISFYELKRNADNYEGNYYQFSGTVIQISESVFTNIIRIAVDDDDDKIIYCTYDCEDIYSEMIEDDRILIRGQSTGLETYTSIFGESITIPSIDINYLENITNLDKTYTIDDTIIFDGLSIKFTGVTIQENNNSYSDIEYAVLFEVEITNLKNESYSLQSFYCTCFDPSGLEVDNASFYFDESISQKGDMRSEATMTGYLAYEYVEDGEYILEFSKFTGNAIEVIIDVNYEPQE